MTSTRPIYQWMTTYGTVSVVASDLESCQKRSPEGSYEVRSSNSELQRGACHLLKSPFQWMAVTSGTDSGAEAWVEEMWYGRVEGGSPDLESCQERPSEGSWGASWLARRPIRL